ncbi:conserved Plasmodium protein, unknown function [Plasmodium berghei]|uniref:Uncharacterized protein n=2 Tax=Plasmodium berghei TaxID=5821 RepID=A0A509AGF4_PLABA|nr:conserved Plasmodium protein, unknown function [Plasmodium berghei ANKA]CXI08790.1 conserved Plasmodium protein, unknown function [Plasmodium berghei]SCL92781.1 conserved Plasmodium protein, unknown function [Plasmodium berghei]SCM15714.1 conserved Plasmodium protein, unknown function [Plasmodium berghei]SCM17509.1 conserved Plasmodium protein, unknown function [Plasmodium berghei]SCN22907.1 conserved Plasmodium protein, unknown function [Plasmodium berghei]|eukprot:XP_034420320.1 conserved Plasmodium protein, unknown function [Plasmodium berghei ANKA]
MFKSSNFKEELVKCGEDEECDYKSRIKIKIGNNQRILFLLKHYKDEYYLIVHHRKLIVAYPMRYHKIAPYKSDFAYSEFSGKGYGNFDFQNQLGNRDCLRSKTPIDESTNVPIFKGFNERPYTTCCSCLDYPYDDPDAMPIFRGIPKYLDLDCRDIPPADDGTTIERIVSVRKTLRHFLPLYALFYFSKTVKYFTFLNITIIKKENNFIDYYKLYKENTLLENIHYKHILDESTKTLDIYDNKRISISHSSIAFDNINIPYLYDQYLLYPFYPEQLYNIKYDTLEYGCTYNNPSEHFECIESDTSKCVYTESTCLNNSILIPKAYIAKREDDCSLIGYNNELIHQKETCLKKGRCFENTIDSYLTDSQIDDPEAHAIKTKLPIINGKYPHYIYKKGKNWKEHSDKRSLDFFKDNNIEHFIAYEYLKEDRTEFVISISNKSPTKKVDIPKNTTNNGFFKLLSWINPSNFNKSLWNKPKGINSEQDDEEKKIEYDTTIFYIETLKELKIINILLSDECDVARPEECGIIIHVWNPSKESITGRLKLHCSINIYTKYVDEQNIVYDEGVYQFLFFFKVPYEKLKLFQNCTISAYGAFKLYDTKSYAKNNDGYISRLFYHKKKESPGMYLYADGIKKFTCCRDDDNTCKIRNIKKCKISEDLNYFNVFIFILINIFIIVFLIYYYNKRRKRNSENSPIDARI